VIVLREVAVSVKAAAWWFGPTWFAESFHPYFIEPAQRSVDEIIVSSDVQTD
jgi:hypothetical protein